MKKALHAVHADPNLAFAIEEQTFGSQNPVAVHPLSFAGCF
jgi:hypothetical protein